MRKGTKDMRVVTGRAGSGKSYYCMNEIKKSLEEGENCPLLYVVPEQFSLSAEYDLSNVIGKGGLLEVQVLTFKRLCHRIYNEFGYKTESISKVGKSMLVYSILKDLEKDLVLLHGVDKKQGLISTMCDLLSELKRYNISPEMLLNVNIPHERLNEKIKEIVYVYSEYLKRTEGKFIDSDDDLSVVKEFLQESKLVKGAKIWIDGFDGFTPQEQEIIKILNKVSDVTIAISSDKDNSELFLLNRKAIDKLKRFANVEEIYLDEIKRFDNPELLHLEKNYHHFPIEEYPQEIKNIAINIHGNYYDEVEHVACQILKNVRDEGYRYENILVATRNIEVYEPIFRMIFDRYQIPYFIDQKSELSVQPLISLIISLLEICHKRFQTESIISYLKTGLTNMEDENDIDALENYVLKYGIKGSKWLEEWTYDENEDVNEKINRIRNELLNPILSFQDKLSSQKTVKEITTCIYAFLLEIHVEENLQTFLKKLNLKEHLDSTDAIFLNSYLQVWNILMKLFDELVLIAGEEKVSFEKYEKMLKAGISSEQIGLIPTNKDQLVIGDISRSRNSHIEIVYVVGVNDGVFPMQYTEEGFLNDNERNVLLENNIEIAKDTSMLLLEENYNIYKILTTPKKTLSLSYSISDSTGSTLRPSMIVNEIKKIFPHVTTNDFIINQISWQNFINTEESTFIHLIENIRKQKKGEEVEVEWNEVYRWYQEHKESKIQFIKSGLSYQNVVSNLSKSTSQGLYGAMLKSSVSQMETFASCPFMYYLKYGLNAKKRKIYQLETPDSGTFLHDILDRFAKYLEENNLSWRELTKEMINRISSQIVEETLKEMRYRIFNSNSRLQFLSIKLKRIIKRIIWIITLQIQNSEFDVAGSEVPFGEDKDLPAVAIELSDGKVLSLKGTVDRIDVAKTAEGKYIRVIDYKSSAKAISLSNVFYGLQLQLITYLDVVSQNEFIPGGALYLKLDDPVVKSKKDISKEEIEEEIRKKLRMNGVILSEARLINAMDTEMRNESANLNLKVKKDGTYGGMPTVTSEELKKLMKHTQMILKQFAEEILNGKIENVPVKNDGKSPCSYCDYKEICNFDKELGNRFKRIHELNEEEVFEQIKIF